LGDWVITPQQPNLCFDVVLDTPDFDSIVIEECVGRSCVAIKGLADRS
jgi:hypothetical protein